MRYARLVVLAVVASAVTAGVVVVIGQEGGGEPPIGPSSALRPSEITKLPPGTPAIGLTAPLDYGPFRVLPAGTAPPPPCAPLPPPGLTQQRVDVRESPTTEELFLAGFYDNEKQEKGPRPPADIDQFRDHDLFFEPPYMPAGWELTEARAETVIWSDGSQTDSLFNLIFAQPDYFDIYIGRLHQRPDCKTERVEYLPEGQHAYTLGEIRGVPVLYLHQAPGEPIQADLRVEFVIDGVLTGVRSVAIDFDELIMIADALIAQFQQGSPLPRGTT